MSDEMLTTREVAERLGVTERSVTRYVQKGKLPLRLFGNQLAFHADDVAAFKPGRCYVDWDARLTEVARLHEVAKRNGTSARREIAEAFDIPIGSGTVDRWLALARERGYIT